MTIIVDPQAGKTFDWLVASVANWLNRPDLTSQIPDFITLAESRLNRDLDNIRAMETKVTLLTVAGTSTVSAPDDLLEMKRLQVLDSYNTVLTYESPDEFSTRYAANLSGSPQAFTVTGGAIELAPIPDAAYTLELTYFQKLPALSSGTTNWLLTNWPDAYLYGTLLAAQPFIVNDARLPVFTRLYQDAVNGINGVDWFSGSTMRVKAR